MSKRSINVSFVFVLALSLTVLTCPDAVADIIYVKEGGTGSGTGWTDAYGELQDGLDDAVSGDEIWVAEGTYYPTYDYELGIGDRGKHFRMKDGVKIYGGFPDNGDPYMTERDPNQYEAILSGDIGTTDDPNDNCYHVFYHPNGLSLDHSAILDGFTITAGNANGPYPHGFGGGMYNDYHNSPTVINGTFRSNLADEGGGMSNTFSSPNVINCTFGSNSAGDAGGMYNYDGSNPTVTGCTFSGNSADHYGGGMANYFFSNPTVTDCTFKGNLAERGGGMANAIEFGDPTVINCIFSGNTAIYEGGGMFNYRTCPIITGCTLNGNSAHRGGGMYNTYSSNPIVTNCIIWGNIASSGGNEIALIESSTIDVAYCDVQGGQAGIYEDLSSNTVNWGSGNIDAEPLFIDADGADNKVGTEDDNLRLSEGSACIDAGNNIAVTGLTDLDGHRRIIDGDSDGEAFVDMGAYEYYGPDYEPITIYVNAGATGGGSNGLSWEDAFISLQYALDAAMIGDEIWVAQGMYKPSVEVGGTGGRYKTFQMRDGVAIYGGFGNTGDADWIDRDPNMYETILSGDIGVGGNNSDNCYHVFYHTAGLTLGPIAILDGFTITAGNADGSYPHNCGGGMFNNSSSPTVTNCTFSSNWADIGGGMCNAMYSSAVTNCTFSGNSADSGGGMCNAMYSRATVSGCTFIGNTASDGGGMCNLRSNPTVTGCTLTGNSAHRGGGMYNEWMSNPTVTNCTFGSNSASYGGGMFNFDSSPTVTNCILWDNTAYSGDNEIYNIPTSTPVISYCDITDCGGSGNWDTSLGTDGGGNIDTDPLFIDADGADNTPGTEDDNLRLLKGSPCIDTGDNSVVDANSTDLDGNPRIINGIVDMGAYEASVSIEVDVHIVPRTINRNNRTKRIMAIIRLPEGIERRDIADEPFVLEPGGIESIRDRVIGRGNMARVFALFDKADLMAALPNGPRVELTITGKLESGQCIYGTDTVRIVQPRRRRTRGLRQR